MNMGIKSLIYTVDGFEKAFVRGGVGVYSGASSSTLYEQAEQTPWRAALTKSF